MEYLKKKIIEELQCINHEIEESGKLNEEQLADVCHLAKTLYYLDKISNTEIRSDTPVVQNQNTQAIRQSY